MSKRDRHGRLVPIGRLSAPHGVRGEVRFRPYDGVEEFTWEEVFVHREGAETRLEVQGVRRHKGFFLLTLRDVAGREGAALLRGLELSVPEDTLPELEENEFYLRDIMGLEVRTEQGALLGRVRGLISAGTAHHVMEIEGPAGEVLVPLGEETVLSVDLERGVVTVSLPEGLLEED